MRRLFECDAYLRAAFNWKLDATKNCISYGIIIFRSFDFDDIRAAALLGAFFLPNAGLIRVNAVSAFFRLLKPSCATADCSRVKLQSNQLRLRPHGTGRILNRLKIRALRCSGHNVELLCSWRKTKIALKSTVAYSHRTSRKLNFLHIFSLCC